MLSQVKQQLESSIIQYLLYLKEISRKIAVREGFDTLLLGSRKRNNRILQVWDLETRISQANANRTAWEALTHAQDSQSDRRLLMGFGLLAGRFEGRRVAAPLLLVELEAQTAPNTGIIDLQYDWESLSLNYDLISILTGGSVDEDDLIDAALLEREFQFVAAVESALDTLFPDGQPDLQEQASYARRHWGAEPDGTNEASLLYDFLISWATYLMNCLRNLLPRLADIHNWSHAYRYTDEWEATGRKQSTSIFDGPVSFVAAAHVVLADVPPQLTAYAALRDLAKEVESKGLRNPLVGNLLGSTLLGLPFELEASSSDPEHLPPISLTETQEKALQLARHAQLSYIQGPPGTGKSHVILAMLLDGLARGERILVVSQKEAALTVVTERLHSLFELGLPPFALYVKADRTRLREELKARVSMGQRSEKPAQQIEKLKHELESMAHQLDRETQRHNELMNRSSRYFEALFMFGEAAEAARQHLGLLRGLYPDCPIPSVVDYPLPSWAERHARLDRLAQLADSPTRLSRWYLSKVELDLQHRWQAPAPAFRQGGFAFARNWLRLHELRQQAQELQPADLTLDAQVLGELEACSERVRHIRCRMLEIKSRIHLLEQMSHAPMRDALSRFEKMLHWRRPALIAQKMEALDYRQVLEAIPLWAAETRHVGELFPLEADLFDLVVIDEASQVNLAEILPVLYRGKRACIVGDHAQLSIESTGLTFALRRKFDALTWSRYRPADLSYEEARRQQLTVTDGSILDLIRNPAHGSWIPQVMLDEHLRSHPALAAFTARFYHSATQPLRVLTDRADRFGQPAAELAWVGGLRAIDRSQPAEIEQVVAWLKALVNRQHPFCSTLGERFSIGILSPIRNQCIQLIERIENEFDEKQLAKHAILIGTPEEFQGNERDVMILSLCLDDTSKLGSGHYQNVRRLNVATSRARLAVFLTAGVEPTWLAGWADYVRLLAGRGKRTSPPWPETLPDDATPWEALIWPVLTDTAVKIGARVWVRAESCGLVLPFALEKQGRSCAFELDGLHRNAHLRHTILRRAGWEVIHSPLSRWQQGADWVQAPEPELLRLRRLLAHVLDGAFRAD